MTHTYPITEFFATKLSFIHIKCP